MLRLFINQPLLVVALLIASDVPAAKAQTPSAPDTVVIDAAAPAHPFPHFWEQMFGSGRAILSPVSYTHLTLPTNREV